MTATYLFIFLAFAACQALLTVKLADWLSGSETTGRGAIEALPVEGLAAAA